MEKRYWNLEGGFVVLVSAKRYRLTSLQMALGNTLNLRAPVGVY